MARCARKYGLEVHHTRRDGGNGLDNAIVLCGPCHEATSSYGKPGPTPAPFSQDTKDRAMRLAGNQCQCTRTVGCH